jgi:hypothetical protein
MECLPAHIRFKHSLQGREWLPLAQAKRFPYPGLQWCACMTRKLNRGPGPGGQSRQLDVVFEPLKSLARAGFGRLNPQPTLPSNTNDYALACQVTFSGIEILRRQAHRPDLLKGIGHIVCAIGRDFQLQFELSHTITLNDRSSETQGFIFSRHESFDNTRELDGKERFCSDVDESHLARPFSENSYPRHAPEWTLFESVKLPEGKVLIPGVLESKTNLIEHPELIVQQICRYANLVGRENVIAGSDSAVPGPKDLEN